MEHQTFSSLVAYPLLSPPYLHIYTYLVLSWYTSTIQRYLGNIWGFWYLFTFYASTPLVLVSTHSPFPPFFWLTPLLQALLSLLESKDAIHSRMTMYITSLGRNLIRIRYSIQKQSRQSILVEKVRQNWGEPGAQRTLEDHRQVAQDACPSTRSIQQVARAALCCVLRS